MTGAHKLPDEPNEWGEVDTLSEGRFRQRWVPGAFGDLQTLAGVVRFRVLREEFREETADGIPERTILEAVGYDNLHREVT